MRLTTTIARSLTCPAGKSEQTYFDDDLPGFGVRVRATGSRTWLAQYAIAGKTKKVFLGSPNVVDGAKARAVAKDVLAAVRLGGNPASDKANERVIARETIGALVPRFLERQRARLKPRSLEETARHLSSHAKPLHGFPVKQVDRRLISKRLTEIATKSGPAAANRVRASLSAFFTWAARSGYVDGNPVAYTDKAVEIGARSRVLTDGELRTIWSVLHDEGQYDSVVKLLILTGARRDEIGSLRWSEIDLDRAFITLPPERTKNRREHVIPLSEPAKAILMNLPRRLESDGSERDPVFGRNYSDGFRNWSTSKRELDARLTAAGAPILDWNLHDFRRSLSTTAHERFGVAPHVVELLLAHSGGHQGGVAGVYNKSLYLEERRRALARWADLILGVEPGAVVAFRR
jgi:integrase